VVCDLGVSAVSNAPDIFNAESQRTESGAENLKPEQYQVFPQVHQLNVPEYNPAVFITPEFFGDN
jgi:hypothetical protein